MSKRITLAQVADLAKDLFYREYKTETDFFDLPHFLYLSCTTYAKIMNDMFQDEKMRNRANDGFSYVSMSGPWLLSEKCTIQKDEMGDSYIQTSLPLFCFDFDALASSLYSVRKVGEACGDLMRISNKDVWKLCSLPVTNDIYYYQLGEKIKLPNLKCELKELWAIYIPAIMPSNLNCTIPETMVDGIVTTVLQIMFGAKKETPFIKIANNSNPNPSPDEIAEEYKD